MNTTKPPAVSPFRFEVLDVALQAARAAIDLVNGIPANYRGLRDQVIRSASSVPANIAEGNGRSGKDRSYHWRVALGSARETTAHIRLLLLVGVLDAGAAAGTLELLDRVRAMLWRLLHPRR